MNTDSREPAKKEKNLIKPVNFPKFTYFNPKKGKKQRFIIINTLAVLENHLTLHSTRI